MTLIDKHFSCLFRNKTCIISINRFERKKNIGLAIEALARMKSYLPLRDFEKVHLVVAGGYDPRLPENVEHLKELKKLSKKCDVSSKVSFFSFSFFFSFFFFSFLPSFFYLFILK